MEDELDRLRRRLYEPGSTSADVEAYRAAEAEHLDGTETDTGTGAQRAVPGSRHGRHGRHGRRGLVAVGAVLLAAVSAAVVVVVARPVAPPPTTVTATTPGGIAVSAAARARFVAALGAGRDPGLLGWLYGHPEAVRAASLTAGRADSTEFTGEGPTTVTLSPTSEKERAGHIVVVLVTDREARYVWRATVVAQRNDRSGPEPAVAAHEGRALGGAPASGTVGYDGGVPTRLTLLLPTGIRWAAVVVYTD